MVNANCPKTFSGGKWNPTCPMVEPENFRLRFPCTEKRRCKKKPKSKCLGSSSKYIPKFLSSQKAQLDISANLKTIASSSVVCFISFRDKPLFFTLKKENEIKITSTWIVDFVDFFSCSCLTRSEQLFLKLPHLFVHIFSILKPSESDTNRS